MHSQPPAIDSEGRLQGMGMGRGNPPANQLAKIPLPAVGAVEAVAHCFQRPPLRKCYRYE